jgi:glycosyltransferase involved in cell wall biosynthesis
MTSSRFFYWIDHAAEYEGNSGVQRVTRALARSLQTKGADLVFVCWSAADQALVRADSSAMQNLSRFDGPRPTKSLKPGEPLHLNGIDGAALCSGWLIVPEIPHFSRKGPLLTAEIGDYCRLHGLKTAFIFYDLIPVLLDGYSEIRDAHAAYVQQLALVDLVLPISRYAGETLIRHWRETLELPASELPEVRPVPLGEALGEDRPKPAPTGGGAIEIVCLGTVEPRKNQLTLLRAFSRLCLRRPDLDLKLNVVGNLHPAVAQAFEALCAENPRVDFRRYLNDREVAALYERASFSVFPSVEEGYGLPIVESLWFGKPVVCADYGAMAEVAKGGGCLMIDVRSEAALEGALERLASDTRLRTKLAAEAKARRSRTWYDYAEDVLSATENHLPLRRVFVWSGLTASQPFNTGIQRVVRSTCVALEALGVRPVCVAWDEDRDALRPLSASEREHMRRWNGPALDADQDASPRPGDWILLAEVIVPTIPGASSLVNRLKARGLKVASIFYDLIPEKMPQFYAGGNVQQFRNYWKMLAEGDLILPISHAVANDYLSFGRLRWRRLVNLTDKIKATPLAGELPAKPRGAETRSRTPGRLELLNVGTLEPRKNQFVLIEAVAAARRVTGQDIRLTLAGRGGVFTELDEKLAERLSTYSWLTYESKADDARLAALYEACDATVYASYEEGFGLPIFESLWAGRPCVCHHEHAIAEAAEGGGCLLADMRDVKSVANALVRLAREPEFYERLCEEAVQRPIKSWTTYARELVRAMGRAAPRPDFRVRRSPGLADPALSTSPRPLLSVCLTTYNRAAWLRHSLKRLLDLTAPYRDVIEIVVCDNASEDDTPAVVAELAAHGSFRAYRNPRNVGMLGNLGVTARHAEGEYVWLLGDDDILVEGAVEDVLLGLLDHPDAELVYLNYAYTRCASPDEIENVDDVVAGAIPIAEGGQTRYVSRLHDVTLKNENLFTAIYCCVFRRRHAIAAYTQNTAGPPFTSLLRCVPSTVYVMRMLLDRPAYWVGRPSLVVNMNVSWKEHVLLWHLERMPELYDWVEREGLWSEELERWRGNHIRAGVDGLERLYFETKDGVRENVSMRRLIERARHLPDFESDLAPRMYEAYAKAWRAGRLSPNSDRPNDLFAGYDIGTGSILSRGAA